MPRRSTPDPLAEVIGARIRQLRREAGLTLEKLAYESEVGSKGYLSDIERGLALPTLATLKRIADHLDILLLDLLTFPEDGARQKLTDRLRSLPVSDVRRVLRELGSAK